MSFGECDWMRGEAGGFVIKLRGSGGGFSVECGGGSVTEMEAILDNAVISVLSTEVGVLRMLLVLACTEKEDLLDAVDELPDCNEGWSMGAIWKSGKVECFDVSCGGMVGKKWR